MSRTLVAYFSASGVTAAAAEKLALALSADLHEIKPAVPYTKADLDWRDAASRSSVEMKNPASRPALADDTLDTAAYDTIYLGFPIWWYVAPTIINTFLEAHDLAGKTIVLFATSGGSGFGKTLAALKDSAPGAVIKEGKLISRRDTVEVLAKWAKSL
ncbi:MAG: flavodoxin [Clostridia bacterium]|nr:flavodoxin [Clostridia bacterium]